jgi:ABC-type transport system involved in multi-copper enzyme maturation permease subunit
MRLVGAEVLKLVRRRGLMVWSLLLTPGAVLIALVIVAALHAANPDKHGPAGGTTNLENYAFLLGGLGNVAAILIGATAGTQDVSNGVFRDLVVTGRGRRALFNARVPGALLVFLPMLLVGAALAVGGAYALAGSKPSPSASYVLHTLVYLVALTAIDVVIAVGIAAFASSRVVVGVLIAWNTIVSHLLIAFGALGGARKLLDVAAAEHFAPVTSNSGDRILMSSGTAALVLVGWAAVALAVGGWWTQRRDA